MVKKRLYEIIKEMSLDEMAEYLCRLACSCGEQCTDVCKDCIRCGGYEAAKTALETELEEYEPVYVPKAVPVRNSYKSAGATMARYIFEGKVNFCFKRPGVQDIVYSVKVDGPEDTPPIQEARESIRKRNCNLCGREPDCDDAHKALCKVTIMRYKKLYKK